MKIAVYTLPYEVANEANKINDLFKAGLEELHLRKPSFNRSKYIELLEAIETQYHANIVIHDYLDLAFKFELKGIHTSASFFNGLIGKLRFLRYKSASNLIISTTIRDVTTIEHVHPLFSKVFLGPLFKKYSASNVKVNFDPFQINKTLQNSSKSVYAMGGIDIKNIERCKGLGFEGIILQSAIWKAENIINAYQSFQLSQLNISSSSSVIKIA